MSFATSLLAGRQREQALLHEQLAAALAGRTNRYIAEAFFLSEHTVRSHVRSILTKTQTENRTAAALFAHEHDLG